MTVGIINSNASGENIKMTGDHSYIAGYDSNTNTRDYYIGTPGAGSKSLSIVNEKNGGIYMASGSNGTTIENTGLINLLCNNVRVGSSTINPATGFRSNLFFLDSGGNNYIAQSSAFTEAIKNDVATSKAKFSSAFGFGGSKGKITLTKNFEIIGQAAGTTQLLTGAIYSGLTVYNVGLAFRSTGLYNDLFDSTGKYVSMEGLMNFNISVEINFTCKNSTVKSFRSYIQINNDEGGIVENTPTQGIWYRTTQTFHDVICYRVGPFKHLIDYGHSILLITNYDFTTSSEATLTRLVAKLTIERNVL
jgi:hypothetical protein